MTGVAEEKKSRGPAVSEAGELLYTSASAIGRFVDCPTSWWFRYKLRLPDPVGPAALAGTEAHARLAKYLTTGVDVLGRYERAALDAGFVPKPGPGIHAELPVDGGLDAGGVPMAGGMDLLDTTGAVPLLTDWKLKGDPGAYAREQLKSYTKPGEWLSDENHSDGRQLIAYGEWFRRNMAAKVGATHVDLRHVYIKSKGTPEATAMTVRLPLDTVAEKWEKVGRYFSISASAAAKADKPEDVKQNLGHCRKYFKPCVYWDRCPASGASALNTLFKPQKESTGMSMLARMKALTSSTDGTVPQVAEAAPAEEPKKRGPGRPKQVPNAETVAAMQEPEAGKIVAATVPELIEKLGAPEILTYAPEKFSAVPAPAAESTVLYFGCSPMGVATKTLHAYVDGLQHIIFGAFKLSETTRDVRLAEVEGLKFGKWKAVLGALVAENALPPGHYVVTYGDERIEAVAEALAGKLAVVPGAVVRGGGR